MRRGEAESPEDFVRRWLRQSKGADDEEWLVYSVDPGNGRVEMNERFRDLAQATEAAVCERVCGRCVTVAPNYPASRARARMRAFQAEAVVMIKSVVADDE